MNAKTKTTVVRLLTSSAWIALSATIPAATSNAATITASKPDFLGREFVDIKGPIGPNDDKTFKNIVGEHPDPERVIVRLVSPGGEFWAGINIAGMISNKGLATLVPKGQICISMCAIIWISGSTRAVEDWASIGFHNMYYANTKQASGKANAVLGAYLGKLGLGYQAIVWMTEQGANGANFLTPNVAKQYNIKFAFAEELPHPVQLPKVTQTPSLSPLPPPNTTTTTKTASIETLFPRADPVLAIPSVNRNSTEDRVVSQDLHLRKEPNPRSEDVLGPPPYEVIPGGTKIQVYKNQCSQWSNGNDPTSTWCKVNYQDSAGQTYTGYVNTRYLIEA